MKMLQFAAAFKALTDNDPFPWQEALYQRFEIGRIPTSCNLPTGLGKTSVIAIWLIARANGLKVPRRLVYVVNRRTVVDQTTTEVEKYFKKEVPGIPNFAISTLRGQYADNREWSADPSKPAVICGTVDMIGSRLLFSGYGVGMKAKPLHAGFLGQDVLLVHDEAHLEPAFQKLIMSIECEQKRCHEFGTFQVMELTATSRSEGEVFELTPAENAVPDEIPDPPQEPIHHVWRRMAAKKALKFHPAKRDSVAATVGEMARTNWHPSGKRVLIFVRTIDDVKTVRDELTKKRKDGSEELRQGVADSQIQVLTGTLRGLERDRMANPRRPDGCPVFARFLTPPAKDAPESEQWKVTPQPGTVFLICTSAGEVGVDLSADHMVCDLSTLDSMAQRFGRVNRRGDGDAKIDVVYETDPDPKRKDGGFEKARWFTKGVIERLPEVAGRRSVSPHSLAELNLSKEDREGAFAPEPITLPATDILFDAWSLTSIRDTLPGRPKVEPYLHGLPTEWQPPETQVAWRVEVEKLQPKYDSDAEREERQTQDRKALAKFAEKLLEDFPLKPHELLQDRMTRVRETLSKLPDSPAWVVDEDGGVTVTTLAELAETGKSKTEYVIDSRYCTILLPPSVSGLNAQGMLDEKSAAPVKPEESLDVSCKWFADKEQMKPRRARQWDNEEPPEGMRLIRRIDLLGGDEESAPQSWFWFARIGDGDDDASKSSREVVTWDDHTLGVTNALTGIAKRLFPDDERFQEVFILAAKWHDLGKKRVVWQKSIGNPNPPDWHAKSGYDRVRKRMWKPYELTDYRHEFGSLVDVEIGKLLDSVHHLGPDEKELVLHLIAAHHGRGRPHFPADEAFDPDGRAAICERIARDTPRRFARLQRKYGRWGLAYLESLLRAADWAASGNPSAYLEGEK